MISPQLAQSVNILKVILCLSLNKGYTMVLVQLDPRQFELGHFKFPVISQNYFPWICPSVHLLSAILIPAILTFYFLLPLRVRNSEVQLFHTFTLCKLIINTYQPIRA